MTKYYFLFFFVFCVLLGGGLYVIHSDPITLSLFGRELSWPLSVWVLGSVMVFFVISLFFLANGWIGRYLVERRLEKDFQHLIDQIVAMTLQKPRSSYLGSKNYKILSAILDRFTLSPKLDSQESSNEKIDQIFRDLEQLERGEEVKKDFPPQSLFGQKNTLNKIGQDLKFAQKVLNEDYPFEIKQRAVLEIIAKDALSEKILHKIFEIYQQQDMQRILEQCIQRGYKFAQEDYFRMFLSIDSQQYLHFAKEFKKQFDPDFCIGLFERLASEKREARIAYVYILLDYMMLDKARVFLAENEDLVLALAYLELKDSGKNYPLESFFI